ncbi:Elongator complex protein 4 [Golovinomyces cichoracearum]|uniref:Elongator complex protein 4 n=1 Tax=Golovinomyces cichoracearum TaxID=62708 RepID=A0A420I3W4_9PEZI|nr:Elongator complex protein 4 [Golovinomyces cichoracearum]
MSFRPRKQLLGQKSVTPNSSSTAAKLTLSPGVRSSPLDGRLTTSTGTRSLDSLLGGHAGLALGSMLLIGETGTTDFSGCLLRYYTAEGAVQGHQVHILGVSKEWGREIPDVSSDKNLPKKSNESLPLHKMKIAWRYERFGEFGADISDVSAVSKIDSSNSIFCHDFDLSRRLNLSSHLNIKFVPLLSIPNSKQHIIPDSPFSSFLGHLISELDASSSTTVHRVVVPSLLSPIFYRSEFSDSKKILQFLHILRALLRQYPNQLTVMISFPLMLYPRSTGITRWIEILSDGVIELTPLPPTPNPVNLHDDAPQGILKIHKLPVFHEKGGEEAISSSSRFGDDLGFTLNRRKGLVIKPFSLPPIGTEEETVKNTSENKNGKFSEADIQF